MHMFAYIPVPRSSIRPDFQLWKILTRASPKSGRLSCIMSRLNVGLLARSTMPWGIHAHLNCNLGVGLSGPASNAGMPGR